MSDELQIVLIAAGWSGAVALLGLAGLWLARRWSLRLLVPAIAVVAVAATLAGVYGTARAMFVSQHDFTVMAWVLGTAGAITGVGAIAVGVVLSRWSRSLQGEVATFAESGHFEAPTGVPLELQDLSHELADASDRLRKARDREERLENSRRELISWVSHDLRSPLAGTRAMAEALEDGIADDPARYHRQIRAEVDRMARMVDDLFELSRIHAGNLELHREQVLLGDLISEALASADPVARARGVRLGGSTEERIEVVADAAEMSRVLSNLVMNAIRHTPADGVVHVAGRAGPGSVEVAVTDSCGGLPDDDLARVFDVSWQRSRARTPDAAPAFGSGAGLGLAIVRGIIEAHAGTITVANQPPGCRFLVRLPAPG